MNVLPPAAAPALNAASGRRLAAVSPAGLPPGLATRPPAEQARAVAAQFEAILLRQFLQESVGSMMGGAKAGPEGNVYGYLLTDVLAGKLAEGGGLGLASILQQQLTPRGGPSPAAADTRSTTP